MRRVMLLGLAALAGCTTPLAPLQRMQALGTEPFWSVEVNGAALHYTTPESPAGTRIATTVTPEAGGTRYSGVLGGEAFWLLIVPGTCSDGMSDTVYPFVATLTLGARSERGCARLR
jgi:uncharacterized membrane protein